VHHSLALSGYAPVSGFLGFSVFFELIPKKYPKKISGPFLRILKIS